MIDNQLFDASVAGLRAYLETTKTTNPALYAQLAPDVEQLEARATQAKVALAAGLVIGLAAEVYAFAGPGDCASPPVTDPNFAADAAAWGACNDDRMRTRMTFGLIGAGVMLAGGAVAFALAPKRADLLDFVNRHNRLSPEPLHLQLGYEPSQHLAFAGVALDL